MLFNVSPLCENILMLRTPVTICSKPAQAVCDYRGWLIISNGSPNVGVTFVQEKRWGGGRERKGVERGEEEKRVEVEGRERGRVGGETGVAILSFETLEQFAPSTCVLATQVGKVHYSTVRLMFLFAK